MRSSPRSMAWALWSAGLTLTSLLSACSLVFDTTALGSKAGEPIDAGDSDVVGDSADEPGNGCPSGEGPAMVRVGDYCVDSTEVTHAQYKRFVAAVGADAGGPSDLKQCASNTSVAPQSATNTDPDGYPVHAIDWCDAKAYCRWAGKDLCGSLHGGPVSMAQANDPKQSILAKACSHDGAQRFPYGDAYQRGRCNVNTPNVATTGVGGCEGGYAGIFDLVGNVGEWLDGCNWPPAPGGGCLAFGGSFIDDENTDCKRVFAPPNDIPWASLGVRCCAPPK